MPPFFVLNIRAVSMRFRSMLSEPFESFLDACIISFELAFVFEFFGSISGLRGA